LSENYVHGSRVFRQFVLAKQDPDGWAAIRQFAAAVLGDSGFVGFESALAAVSVESIMAGGRLHETQ
jgi:hypothetical protein